MIQKLREILEKQSAIISKQKTLILKLNDELRKRNLKSEEVALVLQGVTLGLKNARKGLSFWSSFDAQSILLFTEGFCLNFSRKDNISFISYNFSQEKQYRKIHAKYCLFG